MSGTGGEELTPQKHEEPQEKTWLRKSSSSDQFSKNNEHLDSRTGSASNTQQSSKGPGPTKIIVDPKSSKVPLGRKTSSQLLQQPQHSQTGRAIITPKNSSHANDTTFGSLSKAKTSHHNKIVNSRLKKFLTSVVPKSTLRSTFPRMKLKYSSALNRSSRNVLQLPPAATSNHNKRNLNLSHKNTSATVVVGARQKSHITDRLRSKDDSVQGIKLPNLRSRQNMPSESELQLQNLDNKSNPFPSTPRRTRIHKIKSSDKIPTNSHSHNANRRNPVPSLKIGLGKRITTALTSIKGTTTKNEKSKKSGVLLTSHHKLVKQSSDSSVSASLYSKGSKGPDRRTLTKNSIVTTVNARLMRTQRRPKPKKAIREKTPYDLLIRKPELPAISNEPLLQNLNTLIKSDLEDTVVPLLTPSDTDRVPPPPVNCSKTETKLKKSNPHPDLTKESDPKKSKSSQRLVIPIKNGTEVEIESTGNSNKENNVEANLSTIVDKVLKSFSSQHSQNTTDTTNSKLNSCSAKSFDLKSKQTAASFAETKEQLLLTSTLTKSIKKLRQKNHVRNNKETVNQTTTTELKRKHLSQNTSKANSKTLLHQNIIPKRSILEVLSDQEAVKSIILNNLSSSTRPNKQRHRTENVQNIGEKSTSSEVNTQKSSIVNGSTITPPTPPEQRSHLKKVTSKTARSKTELLKSPKARIQNENRPVTYSSVEGRNKKEKEHQIQNLKSKKRTFQNIGQSYPEKEKPQLGITEYTESVIAKSNTKNSALSDHKLSNLQSPDNDNKSSNQSPMEPEQPNSDVILSGASSIKQSDVIVINSQLIPEPTFTEKPLTSANIKKEAEKQSELEIITKDEIDSQNTIPNQIAKQDNSSTLINVVNPNSIDTGTVANDVTDDALSSGRDSAVDGDKSPIADSGINKIPQEPLSPNFYNLLKNCESYNTWMDVLSFDDDTIEEHINRLRLHFRNSFPTGVTVRDRDELTWFNALESISNLGALCFFQLRGYHFGDAQVTVGKTKAFVGQCLRQDASLRPYLRSFDYVWDFVRLYGSVREYEVSGQFNHFPEMSLKGFVPHFHKLNSKVKAGVLGLKFYFYGVIRAPFSKQIELIKRTISLDGEYFEWHCCLQKLLRSKYRVGIRTSNHFLHAESSGTQEFRMDALLKEEVDAAFKATKLLPSNLRCNLAVVEAFADLIRFQINNNKWEAISFGLEKFPTAHLCFTFIRDMAKYIVQHSASSLDVNLEIADIFTAWLPRRFRDLKLGKECLERCLKYHARSSDANCKMGQYYLNVHSNYAQAEKYFDIAFALDENNYAALEDLLLIMMRTVVSRQALILGVIRLQLDNTTWTKTQLANLHFLRGLTLLGVSNSKEAFQEFIKAYQLNKHSVSFRSLSAIHEHYDWPGWPNRTVFNFGSMRLEAEFFQEEHLSQKDGVKQLIMAEIIKNIDKAETVDKKMGSSFPSRRPTVRSLASKTRTKALDFRALVLY